MSTSKKNPFLKMILLCFPIFKKKPTQEQTEIIEIINDTIDHVQDILKGELEDDIQMEQDKLEDKNQTIISKNN